MSGPLRDAAQARAVVGSVPLADFIARPGALDEHFETVLRSRLAGVELGAYDERIVSWLAGWDAETVGAVCSLLDRVRDAARGGPDV